MENNKRFTTENLLTRIGSFGLYQKLLMVFAIYAVICWAVFLAVTYFIIAEPRWQCVQNSTICNLTESIGPGEANYDYRCGIPRQEWKFVDEYTSLVTQFDLVCDKSTFGKHINTMTSTGFIAGSLIGGLLSDKYGRKIVFFASGFLYCASFLVISFSTSYLMAAVPVFFAGFGGACTTSTAFVWVVEYVGIKHRSFIGNGLWLSYALGYMILPGLGYLIRDWRMLTLLVALIGVPVFPTCCLVPDSLRWMITNRSTQALKTIQKIAKINKKPALDENIQLPKIEAKVTSGDVRLLFTSGYGKATLVIWYSWFVNALIYDSVHLSAPSVGGSAYLNWFLSGLAELLSTFFCIYAHNRFGRKKCIIFCQIMASLSSIGSVILTLYDDGSPGYLAGKILMSMVLAKFFITISYDGIYLLTAEYYPTIIRNVALGASAMFSGTGGIIAGYVTHSIRVNPLLPYIITGANAFLSAILCLSLRETNNHPLLEVVPTMKEMDTKL